jgi:riboflavin synthase
MFTGIIEGLGKVAKINKTGLTVKTNLSGINTGDSISVNGVCLTVRTLKPGMFTADISDETYKRTNLGELKSGGAVNIERALKPDSRLGGHIVTGHIEGVGKILSTHSTQLRVDTEHRTNMLSNVSKHFLFSYPESMRKYIVPKGSIAVDGISLTVVEVKEKSFSVSVIPHTLKNTTLGFKKINDTVNLEPDVLAKYTENILKGKTAESGSKKSKITWQYLKNKGYM